MAIEKSRDHINQLRDNLLVHILSLVPYKDAVRASSVSRRWEHLHTKHPNVSFKFSEYWLLNSTRATPSVKRVQSMEHTLHRRCPQDGSSEVVKKLCLEYRKDIPMECHYADKFVALAAAQTLELTPTAFRCTWRTPDDDAGPWSLKLPPTTAELTVAPRGSTVRLPRIHGPGVNGLKSLTLSCMVLRSGWLQDTSFPSLEHLHITYCMLPCSLDVTSDNMPCLKHLTISDVGVMITNDTDTAINVLADELRTLRMSCPRRSFLQLPSSHDRAFFYLPFLASFTQYSAFHLRAPKLEVFHWNCCYAREVRVESVGNLLRVVINLKAGRLPKRQYGEESRFIRMEDCEWLTREIIEGLMPGSWNYVERNCIERDETQLCCEIASDKLF